MQICGFIIICVFEMNVNMMFNLASHCCMQRLCLCGRIPVNARRKGECCRRRWLDAVALCCMLGPGQCNAIKCYFSVRVKGSLEGIVIHSFQWMF